MLRIPGQGYSTASPRHEIRPPADRATFVADLLFRVGIGLIFGAGIDAIAIRSNLQVGKS